MTWQFQQSVESNCDEWLSALLSVLILFLFFTYFDLYIYRSDLFQRLCCNCLGLFSYVCRRPGQALLFYCNFLVWWLVYCIGFDLMIDSNDIQICSVSIAAPEERMCVVWVHVPFQLHPHALLPVRSCSTHRTFLRCVFILFRIVRRATYPNFSFTYRLS